MKVGVIDTAWHLIDCCLFVLANSETVAFAILHVWIHMGLHLGMQSHTLFKFMLVFKFKDNVKWWQTSWGLKKPQQNKLTEQQLFKLVALQCDDFSIEDILVIY